MPVLASHNDPRPVPSPLASTGQVPEPPDDPAHVDHPRDGLTATAVPRNDDTTAAPPDSLDPAQIESTIPSQSPAEAREDSTSPQAKRARKGKPFQPSRAKTKRHVSLKSHSYLHTTHSLIYLGESLSESGPKRTLMEQRLNSINTTVTCRTKNSRYVGPRCVKALTKISLMSCL